MKEIVKEIQDLNQYDLKSYHFRATKLVEEFGEMVQAVNKLLGKKIWKEGDTRESIVADIKEETADTIQCYISFLDSVGVSGERIAEDFQTLIDTQTKEDYDAVFNLDEEDVCICIMGAMGDIHKECRELIVLSKENMIPLQKNVAYAMTGIFVIAFWQGITPESILDEILVKNKKWRSVAEKIKAQQNG